MNVMRQRSFVGETLKNAETSLLSIIKFNSAHIAAPTNNTDDSSRESVSVSLILFYKPNVQGLLTRLTESNPNAVSAEVKFIAGNSRASRG